MFGKYFYNKNIRNIVILFGTIFNDISIRRVTAAGVTQNQFKVPIGYGPAQKYLSKLKQQQLDENEQTGITLPRMSFEITTMVYDTTRKLQTTKKIREVTTNDNTKLKTIYTPVPYNFEIDLSIMVKNSDDGSQILEQILPYFTPEFHVTMNEMTTLGIKRDIPVVLTALTTQDEYEGDFLTRRALIHTLSFTVQGYIYGPTKDQGIIREVDVNTGFNFNDEKEVNIDVKPNPLSADPDDDYTTTTTVTQPIIP
jgi:hypothetical protein